MTDCASLTTNTATFYSAAIEGDELTVILMDLEMPIMDGLTSTRNIRKFEKEHDLPRCHIVALTGLASAQDQQDAQDAGVDLYLVKPVKFADVKRIFGTR